MMAAWLRTIHITTVSTHGNSPTEKLGRDHQWAMHFLFLLCSRGRRNNRGAADQGRKAQKPITCG